MKKVSFFILSLLLILTSLALSADEKTNKKEIPDFPSFIGYVPNEIVVKFDASITAKKDKKSAPKGKLGIPSLDQVGSRYNAISVLPQFPKAKKKKYRGKEVDLSGWHKIKFGRKVDVKAVVKEYKKISGVIDAQPIGIHSLYASYPNDPFFYLYSDTYWNQWHLDQKVEKRCDPNVDADIDAPEAWDIETGDFTLIVAVLDTGVRYFHRDLGGSNASLNDPGSSVGNMWINSLEKNGVPGQDDEGNEYIDDWIGYDFVDGATNTDCSDIFGLPPGYINCPCWDGEDCEDADNDPRDFHGHGTHVAGIVAALNNNAYGTASAAGGWGNGNHQSEGNGVKIMPLRICYSAGDTWLTGELGLCRMDFAAEALYYAADNGAHFVNASWGSGNEGGIADAIDYFLASGGIIVVAAGNGYSDTADYIPSRNDPGIISVAATDCADCKVDFSNYGDWVDISAPGKDILSSYHDHSPDKESLDFVRFMSGTSMASPLALGVAALIWSKHPTLTACQVEQRLYDSADDIYGLGCNLSPTNYGGKLGAGRVNAYNAVNIECSSDDGDGDSFSPCMGDCDDSNDSINPEATEICDGLDNDCDCFVDEGVATTYYQDSDEDGYGNASVTQEACSPTPPEGYVADNTDCDDNNANSYPGATEECDNKDNDCDGSVDEDIAPVSTTCGVGECADNTGNKTCSGGSWNNTCDPFAGATAEECDNKDNDCDGEVDEDLTQATFCGDGACAATGVETCTAGVWGDDTCAPGQPGTEICDNVDNDCDGSVDEDLTQATSCGVGACAAAGEETCSAGSWVSDTCASGQPGTEICDNVDNDCDGSVDEDLTQATSCGVGACAAAGEETCSAGSWVSDTCAEDDFTGDDNDPPDPRKWNESDSENATHIKSNKFYFKNIGTSNYESYGASSKWFFTGDFDIRIDWDHPSTLSGPAIDSNRAPYFQVHESGWTNLARISRASGNAGQNGYLVEETGQSAVWDQPQVDSSGKLRLVRSGSTITAWYWTGTAWEWNGSSSGFTFSNTFSNDLYVWVGNHHAEYNQEVNIDNFVIFDGCDTCTPGTPGTETCNNVDDDCDGLVDEDLTQATTCGVGECASTGVETCTDGLWGGDTCTPGDSSTEVCDGLDNDCNGTADDIAPVQTNCGVGECAATGTETCVDGQLVDDCLPGTPSAEVCDNIDNNCDGNIDEELSRTTTCGLGACAGNTGTETCSDGVWGGDTCDPLAGAAAEACDNIDNDCDGSVDENLTQTTTCGLGECAGNTGIETCTAGSWGGDTCDPLAGATTEACDGQDNDCDGTVDDGISPVPTACGVGECAATGTLTCENGQPVDTCTPGDSSTEVCDGLDNDCNGTADDIAPVQTNCGVGECAATGTETCVDGQLVDDCLPGTPSAEVCDNIDNNCDGNIDEELSRTTTCGLGECAGNTGIETCTAGSWGGDTCDPLAGATTEACDGQDNDCDGTVDDGISPVPTACGVGECAATGTLTCENGQPVDTCTPGDSSTEVCDGLDNDCNGTADDIAPVQTNCGVGECAATGTETCVDGQLVDDCLPGTPSAEVCDNIDNNCDGNIDEELSRTTTCGVGACAGNTGTETCSAGAWGGDTCDPLAGATTEACDGQDNDCDGTVDDGISPVPTACGVGECAATGTLTCENGQPVDTCTPGDSSTEVCDGLDNDCNGTADDIAPVQTNCGVGECAATGTETCVDGQLVDDCLPGTPSAEVCDNIDNDCDGSVDENLTQTTTCGLGECAGNTGIETCTAGSWGGDTCDPLAGAAAEACDNIDNDCDGAVDENLTQETTCGVGECAATGVETCTNGLWGGDTCSPGQPGTETCDNKDNDCDGAVDENLTQETTCGVGECAATGVETCTNGLWGGDTCSPGQPGTETCDNKDNDCDGAVDEGLSCDAYCGNDVCEDDEDCSSCPNDCIGKTTGKPSSRYCCGDGACEEAENASNCAIDCGPAPNCGDGTCNLNEDECSCPADCGAPPSSETSCTDGIDNDCDTFLDCDDSDCDNDPACICKPKDSACTTNSECCSNNCRGKKCK